MKPFVRDYFQQFRQLTAFSDEIFDQLNQIRDRFVRANERGNKIMIMGNGGSAAMASHVSVDLTKNAGIRAMNFNEADLITCFANDLGYEQWMKAALRFYANKNDVIVLISSSGRSRNVVNAANYSTENHLELVTLTGMDKSNPLKSANPSGINLWVNSKAYNLIEMTHHFWLLCVVDMIIGNAEYPA